jgi:hypothetical protein
MVYPGFISETLETDSCRHNDGICYEESVISNTSSSLVASKVLGKSRGIENNKTDNKKLGCEDMNWIHLAQVTVQWRGTVKEVMNLRVP